MNDVMPTEVQWPTARVVALQAVFLLQVTLLVLGQQSHSSPMDPGMDIHGGVQMGTPMPKCDDANWNLKVDWDNSTDYEYTCQSDEPYIPVEQVKPTLSCLEELPRPLHMCMNHEIVYTDLPPRGGPHRPLWPVYGEYLYIPPQRWVHSLEHGAAVFLYHPCADPQEVNRLRDVAKSCLRRHIITPYRQLPVTRPIAVVTWGCRLMMNKVHENAIKRFVQDHALHGREDIWKDGQYSLDLIDHAQNVTDSDHEDSNLCPGYREYNDIDGNNLVLQEYGDKDRESLVEKLKEGIAELRRFMDRN